MGIHTVTGAFGYSGKYITQLLLAKGYKVQTLTNSPLRANPFGSSVSIAPFCFADRSKLAELLRNTDVLYNTYWVRFNHKLFNHHDAVENTLILFEAAKLAGVKRIVHMSITNPSESSELEYFRGKATIENHLLRSGLSYAILRPAVLFGHEDILINNIAWALRHFPVFGVFGDGAYRLDPIHVEDLAHLCVLHGSDTKNVVLDAIGPESYSYRDLVGLIGKLINKPRPILSVSPEIGYLLSKVIGSIVGDIFVTREEIAGLMQGLLHVTSRPSGTTKLSDWIRENSATLGLRYASELSRRKDRSSDYASL